VTTRAVRRFSDLAGGALAVVGVTGLIRAGVEVETLEALTSSLFGGHPLRPARPAAR
jgi:putative copper export protein